MTSRKTLINVIVSGIYQVIAIICGLITPRLLLTAFGSTYYGAFSSVTQFLGIISMLSMGIPGASRLELYRLLSIKDENGISKVVKATQKYSQRVSAIIILYSGILCLIFPHISNSDLSARQDALIIVIVAVGLFAEYFFGMAYYNVIDADQKQYIRFILKIITTIANTSLVAFLIHLGCNVFVVKLGSSIVFAFSPLVIYMYVKRVYHIDSNVDADMSVIPERKNVLIHALSSFVYEHVDIFVITIFMDVKYVSIYTVYHVVIHYLRLLLEIFTGDMETVFGKLWLDKNNDRLGILFNGYETFACVFISTVFTTAGVMILPFVSLYTAGVHDINYYYVDVGILIVLSEALYCVRDPYRILIQATGSYEQTKVGVILEATMNLLLSVVLTVAIGMEGVLIGTIISTLFTIIQFSWFSEVKLLGRDYILFLKRLLWMAATSAVVLIICLNIKVIDLSSIGTWIQWLQNGIAAFGIAIIVTVCSVMIFYRKDMMLIVEKLKIAVLKHS